MSDDATSRVLTPPKYQAAQPGHFDTLAWLLAELSWKYERHVTNREAV